MILIAVDRWFFINKPWTYRISFTKRKAVSIIVIIWVLSAIINILFTIYGRSDFRSAMHPCSLPKLYSFTPFFVKLAISVVTTMAIVAVCYLSILLKIIKFTQTKARKNALAHKEAFFKKHFTKIRKKNISHNSDKLKACKTSVFILAYVSTIGIYFIACTLYFFCTEKKKCDALLDVIDRKLSLLGFLNSLINPILYAWWHKGFRKAIKELWKNHLRKRRKYSIRTNENQVAKMKTISTEL